MAGTYIPNIPGLNREKEGNIRDTSMMENLSRFRNNQQPYRPGQNHGQLSIEGILAGSTNLSARVADHTGKDKDAPKRTLVSA